MKKFLTMCMTAITALVLVLVLTACGGTKTGYYKITSATAMGMEVTGEQLSSLGFDGYLKLNDGGKGELTFAGETQELTWDDKTLTADGDSIEYTLENDTITIDKDGTKLVFTYDADYKPAK